MTPSPRAAHQQEAILGAFPSQVYEPRSVDELSEIVAATSGEGLVLAPLGSGTAVGLGRPLERYDVAIRTRGLNRIVDYAPEDQVVVAEAGVTLDELQQVLWRNRQRLALDPPGGEGMTIGGLLATNAYGPRSLGYGTPKDLIVGIEAVRADGAIVRGGGKVVKNVAGFDLPKLLVGSLGTLAIVSKATFRVHPLPEKRASLDMLCPRARLFPFVAALREAQLEPSWIVASHDAADAWRVEVGFEGFAAGVDAQVERGGEVAAGCGIRAGDPGRRPAEIGSGDVALKGTYPPGAFEALAPQLEGSGMTVRAYPATGVVRLHGESAGADEPGAALGGLRRAFASHGGTLVIECMPRAWYGAIDPWGDPPASFGIMQQLKLRFDPQRRLNRGRFVGGI